MGISVTQFSSTTSLSDNHTLCKNGRNIQGNTFTSATMPFLSYVDNHSMVSYSPLSIRILDVNDNPPELATPYEASICEDAKPGQVSLFFKFF